MGWFHFVRRYSYEKIKMQISCNNRLHPAFLFHAACSASPGTRKSLAPLESEAQAVSFAGSERITAYLLRKPQRKLRPIASQPTGIENPSPQKAADQSEECWKKFTARLEEQYTVPSSEAPEPPDARRPRESEFCDRLPSPFANQIGFLSSKLTGQQLR